MKSIVLNALLFFGLSLLATSSNAQSNAPLWNLDFYYTPSYTNYYAPQREQLILVDSPFDAGYSFTVGLGLGRKLSKNSHLQIGLALFGTSSVASSNLRWGSEHNGDGTWSGPDPTNPIAIDFQEYHYFLQVPVHYRYYFQSTGFRFYLQPGLSVEALVGRRGALSKQFQDGQVLTAYEDYRDQLFQRLNLLLDFRVGAEKNINERVALFLEPSARATLFEVAKNAIYPTRRYSFGASLGFRMSI